MGSKTTYTEGYIDGYNKAIDEFVDKAWEMLGAGDRDIYARECIDEHIVAWQPLEEARREHDNGEM